MQIFVTAVPIRFVVLYSRRTRWSGASRATPAATRPRREPDDLPVEDLDVVGREAGRTRLSIVSCARPDLAAAVSAKRVIANTVAFDRPVFLLPNWSFGLGFLRRPDMGRARVAARTSPAMMAARDHRLAGVAEVVSPDARTRRKREPRMGLSVGSHSHWSDPDAFCPPAEETRKTFARLRIACPKTYVTLLGG